MAKDTPASRAKRRRDPAVMAPPPKPKGKRTSVIPGLALVARGRTYPIGDNVENGSPWSMGMDQTGTVTLPIRDTSDAIVRILGDESNLQQDGVEIVVDGTRYVVTGVDFDGLSLYTLTVEDEVSWRLKQFSSYRSANRKRITRFGFIQGFVDEASRAPLPQMRSFIPEIDDKQPIARAKIPTSNSNKWL